MAAIDSSPLSASSIERRNSLEKRLQLRPEAQDLRNRHILVGEGVAPETPAAELDLDAQGRRRSTSDSLQRQLEKRPEREELVGRNILPSETSTSTAPSLQAQARDLQRSMMADNLEQKVRNRPGPDELIAQGILSEEEDPRVPAY